MAAAGAPGGVRVEKRGAVAILWLDRPPVNVLSAEVLESLYDHLGEVGHDREVRAVVLASAQERAFAAGANIREMAPMGPVEARVHGGRGQGVTLQIERLPLPVIAAVHGTCVGGGCEIALACDVVIASEDAVFGQPEINLGVMPGWGGTRRLPRRIGAVAAREWIFSGKTYPASEAARLGLVREVVPRAVLLERAVAIATELAQKPSAALAAAKYAINATLDPGIVAGLGFELDLWCELFGTPDQREGMAAFLEKRPPKFAGRTAPRFGPHSKPAGRRPRSHRAVRRRATHRSSGKAKR